MSKLLELAERCEAAEGPDAVLDGMIEAALRIAFPLDLSQFSDDVPIEYEADEDDGRVSIYIGRRKFKRYRAPAFTASPDAALSLVPEGWAWSVGFDHIGKRAIVGPLKSSQTYIGKAATPALALCAAALRARAAQ